MFIIQAGDYPQDVAKVYGAVHVSELLSSGNLSLQPLVNDLYYIHSLNFIYPTMFNTIH